MHTRLAPRAAPADITQRSVSTDTSAPDLIEDLLFLEVWERGLIPWLGTVRCVRQIRRANPALAAQPQGNPTPPGTAPPTGFPERSGAPCRGAAGHGR